MSEESYKNKQNVNRKSYNLSFDSFENIDSSECNIGNRRHHKKRVNFPIHLNYIVDDIFNDFLTMSLSAYNFLRNQ